MARYRYLALMMMCLWGLADSDPNSCDDVGDCTAEDATVLLQSMVQVSDHVENEQKASATEVTEVSAEQQSEAFSSSTDSSETSDDAHGEEQIMEPDSDADEKEEVSAEVIEGEKPDIAVEDASGEVEQGTAADNASGEEEEDGENADEESEDDEQLVSESDSESDKQELSEESARRHRRRRARRHSARRRRSRRSWARRRRTPARRRRSRRSSARRRRTPARRRRSFFARRRRSSARRRASIFARRRRSSARRRASIFARRRRTSAVNNGKINDGCAWVNCAAVQSHAKSPKYFTWTRGFAVLAGNGKSTCCTAEKGLDDRKQYHLMSASKMVAAYTILAMVGAKKLTLETPVSDILTDFWTKSPNDKRSQIKVKHLLDQTDGFPYFKGGMANCQKPTTQECAKEAYDLGVKSTPGTTYEYTETSFYIIGAVAIKASGMKTSNFNDVFKRYLGTPLGMSCDFKPDPHLQKKYPYKIDPGAHLWCSAYEYAKFLRAVTAKKVPGVPSHLVDLAEKPHTQRVSMTLGGQPVGARIEYGYGLWRHCQTERCDAKKEVTLVHSMGMYGFIPVIYRKGSQSMWMIVARSAPPIGIPDSMKLVTAFTPYIVPFKLSGTAPMQQNGLISRHPMKFNR